MPPLPTCRFSWWACGILCSAALVGALRGVLPHCKTLAAAQAIQQAGGSVHWRSALPAWLPGTGSGLARHLFDRLTEVDLSQATGTRAQQQAALAALSACRDLQSLDLSEFFLLDDADLTHLQQLKHLESLALARTRVSSRGLQTLASLPRLHTLNLHDTAIGDTDLATLARLAKLATLNLDGTRVSSAGIAALQPLAALKCLSVSNTAVDETALEALRGANPNLAITDD